MKQRLSKIIRGWLPTDPNLLSFAKIQAAKVNVPQKSKLPKSGILLFSLFTIFATGLLHESNSLGAPMLWIAVIVGVLVVADVLVSQGKDLNPKITMALLVSVVTLGGVLVNVYVFAYPSSLLSQAFSLVLLVLVNVPLLVGVTAYVWGKKELSKKLISWFTTTRRN